MKKPSKAKPGLDGLDVRVRRARLKSGLTQAALARAVGVTASAVGQWEHPRGTAPSYAHLIAIARATQVTVEWLIDRRAQKPRNPRATTAEEPALSLSDFARDATEEQLLELVRRIRDADRKLLLALAERLAGRRKSRATAQVML
jgi:transcriptional regulator with XRE-family HTH domain